MDQVIRDVVAPCVAGASGGGALRWFFLRSWQKGPHIRVRRRDLPDADARTVQRDLSRRLATVNCAVPRERWLTPAAYRTYVAPLARAGELGRRLSVSGLVAPGVRNGHYEPEYSRYGGCEAVDDAEASFRDSSELAVGLLARRPGQAARCGLGLFAAAVLFRLMTKGPVRLSDWLSRGFVQAGWQ
ncbi:lantibiotic dehydratase C-terminal domain-containing protein [Streptomyces rimosus]|uniref:lantibiotic dehydratase C-terminal domain-containing protein n=1 Tax=Streptomyces rimosus TaxID=1927 RepID=UPI0031CFA45B